MPTLHHERLTKLFLRQTPYLPLLQGRRDVGATYGLKFDKILLL